MADEARARERIAPATERFFHCSQIDHRRNDGAER
jgi:hypothetical protein